MRRYRMVSKGKRAFTLVEMIVVLLILAVLAAMLVPALTGYIRKARRGKYIQMADAARVAAQAVMQERYALDAISTSADGNAGNDYRWDDPGFKNSQEDKDWGLKVLELMGRGRGAAGNEPYLLIFGVGNAGSSRMGMVETHTVYYVAYVESETSPAVFYVNGEWYYTYPRGDDRSKFPISTGSEGYRNTIVDGNIPLQLIVVSNRTGQPTSFWTGDRITTLQGHSERSDGTYRSEIVF